MSYTPFYDDDFDNDFPLNKRLFDIGCVIWKEVKGNPREAVWLARVLERRIDSEEYQEGDAFWECVVADTVCREATENPIFAERLARFFSCSIAEPTFRKFIGMSADILSFAKRS
jgi:hypothetical protein